MAIEIVDFPIKNGGFSIAMLVYQRVYGCICYWFVSFQPCRHVRSKNPGFLQTKWAISLKHFYSYRVVHPQLSVGYCWFKLRIYIHIYHYINLLNRVSVGYCWFISLHELSIYIYLPLNLLELSSNPAFTNWEPCCEIAQLHFSGAMASLGCRFWCKKAARTRPVDGPLRNPIKHQFWMVETL